MKLEDVLNEVMIYDKSLGTYYDKDNESVKDYKKVVKSKKKSYMVWLRDTVSKL